MKKLISMIMVVMMALSLASAGLAEGKSLVVYFSLTGNTQTVAELVAEQAGADLARLEPADPYPSDRQEQTDRATLEREGEILPELTTVIDDIDQYDTIYIGYPIWQGYYPQVIASFLNEYDLSGKNIAPFCTCNASGLGETPEIIQSLQPDANMLEGLAIMNDEMPSAQAITTDWVNTLSN